MNNTKKSRIYINDKIVDDVNYELNKIYDEHLKIIKNIYSDETILKDIINFLNLDTISYLKYKIDKLYTSNDFHYRGIENFANQAFNTSDNLKEITFVSFSRNEKSTFDRLKEINVESLNENEFYDNGKLIKSIGKKGNISFVGEIKDTFNFKKEGLIALTFKLDNLKYIIQKYDSVANVLVLDDKGYIVYDSNGVLQDELYNYYDKKHGDKYYAKSLVSKGGFKALSVIDVKGIDKLFYNSVNYFIFICLFIIVLVLCLKIYYFKIKSLSDRTDTILNAIGKIKNGDLDTEIPLTSDLDEINYIAENFNYICKDLIKYIDKSYKAETEQKKLEMVALQSQINLHFLYNTLESIRMKAICTGNKEIGKMIYTLSFLFRQQLKEKNVISIKSELEYCEKYIEIFKYRYPDTFNVFIECNDEFKNMQIIKFSIQPLVENYFIHGIRLEDKDNVLNIKVSKEENNIVIEIIDNGKGIDDIKLDMLNNKIKNKEFSERSMGIINVHKRIIMEYGQEYGISLQKSKYGNNISLLKIPCKEL